MSPVAIRVAEAADAAACREIYAPYVTDTVITFEYDVPSVAELQRRIAGAYRWLIAERDGELIGYAYAGPFKARAAYDWACEVSVYLRQGLRRTGAGRALYTQLLDDLTECGFRTAVGVITVPNEASVGLHTALGFRPVGTFERIGWKHGGWHDVYWCRRELGPDPEAPPRFR
ncbi:GNAT family N-acetyltransferase [Naumannella halotolerans]|uniref:Phosphinothricin acetyltransferase n=1 Tax=Naumannella halotolerans TaxID=993414 RepID=A0A4R7J1D4_9ACTN|nr:GNAT family N-acetyltransferase [Naumannella halotolerans]TDT30874.1 phosphinothricin acetyltransferase [Naumannella halotolerans]